MLPMLVMTASLAQAVWGAGSVPGVAVRFADGLLHEAPTGRAQDLIQDELCPDRPFLQPLSPVSLEAFRRFYDPADATTDVAAKQLAAIHRAVATDPEAKAQYQALLAEARGMRERAVPLYEPSPFHWVHAPAEVTRETDRQAEARGRMRRACALAFALSGDERLAQKAWEAYQAQISHFYTYGVFRMPYSWQSPWDSGFELYEAGVDYALLSHWEALHPLDHALVMVYLRRLATQVAYAVELSPVIGSQQAMWTCNLGCLAEFAPSLPEANQWKLLAQERLDAVMADFMPDGGHIEGDPQAQATALCHLLRYADALTWHGESDLIRQKWGPAEVTVEGALDWLTRVATPLGYTPAVNNSPRLALAECEGLVRGMGLFRRGDWLYASRRRSPAFDLLSLMPTDLPPQEPGHKSVLLPDSGLAVIRDGWAETDPYLILDWGRHGGPTGHLDKMSFEMVADGQPWVLDAGPAPHISVYAEQHEYWHRQTAAHNTILVDQKSQAPTDGKLVMWHQHPDFVLAAAEHDGYEGIRHRRTVFHPTGGYFLIFDELLDSTNAPHDLRWLLHVNGTRESGTIGRVLFWREGGYGLVVLPPKQRGLRGVSMGEGPCLGCDGLSASAPFDMDAPDAGPGAAGWGMIPYIGLNKDLPAGKGQTFCAALIPFKGREPEATLEVTDGRLAYCVEVVMGDRRDLVLIRRAEAPPGMMARDLPLATNARYAYVREVKGKAQVMEWVDGDSLWIDKEHGGGR